MCVLAHACACLHVRACVWGACAHVGLHEEAERERTQRDSDGPLGFGLTDNIPLELGNDLLRCQCGLEP